MEKPSTLKSSMKPDKVKRRVLSDKEVGDIKEAFDLFDTNHDGYINYHELKVAIRALGFDINKPQTQKLIHEYGDINNGKVQWLDFKDINTPLTRHKTLRLVSDMFSSRSVKDNITRAFRIFDYDNSGRITVRKLRRIAKEIDQDLSEDMIKSMIKAFDENKDGESLYSYA